MRCLMRVARIDVRRMHLALLLTGVVVAASACRDEAASDGREPHAASEQLPPPVQVKRLTLGQIGLSSMRDGKVAPLQGDALLASTDTLQVDIRLAGESLASSIELRIGDDKGNGVFRGVQSQPIHGETVVSFSVPAPDGGWKQGRYLVLPAIDNEPREAVGFGVE